LLHDLLLQQGHEHGVMQFYGLSAFPITPADAEGQVIAADLRGIVRRAADAGVDSLCVLGSTGSYAYLDPDQRRVVAEAAAAATGSAGRCAAGRADFLYPADEG
jgi:4-hydroxy-tetrahydrodipicolinate synthase